MLIVAMKRPSQKWTLMTEQSQPLAGVHVLDFGMNIAGPQAASLLADLGAEVIKVEGPGGDSSRGFAPQADGISALFATMNRNKRYLGLDLTKPGAQAVLKPLLHWADVVIQNLRPGQAAAASVSRPSRPMPSTRASFMSTSRPSIRPSGCDRATTCWSRPRPA